MKQQDIQLGYRRIAIDVEGKRVQGDASLDARGRLARRKDTIVERGAAAKLQVVNHHWSGNLQLYDTASGDFCIQRHAWLANRGPRRSREERVAVLIEHRELYHARSLR